MKTSKSKQSDLDIIVGERSSQPRSIDNAKNYGGFTSFFARSKRNKLPTPVPLSPTVEIEASELHDLSKRELRRSSLGSRNYKAMSRSMNDLGSLMSRVHLNDSIPTVMEGCPSPVRSISARRGSSDLSPTKRKTSKKELSTPFSATTIKKEGWLNKRGNKKEPSMRLYRVNLRDSKLYVYKPPSDVNVKAFDLTIPQTNSPTIAARNYENLQSPEQLAPADFTAELRVMLFDMGQSLPTKRFSHAIYLSEMYGPLHDPPTTENLAVITTSSLVLCKRIRHGHSPMKQDSTWSSTQSGHLSHQSLWLLEEEISVKLAQISVEETDVTALFVIQQGDTTRRYACGSREHLSEFFEHYKNIQASSITEPTVVAGGIAVHSTTAEHSKVLQTSQELFNVRQIIRNDVGKIIRGTVAGLCRQILLEKPSHPAVNTLGSVLLSTVGLWASAEDILKECCTQMNVLADNATRHRPEHIVRALITSAKSLLLDSRKVEGLLQLIKAADTEQQILLKKELWERRSHLLAVITMDHPHPGAVSAQLQEPWGAQYQSISHNGLQAESILTIPANLFATQLHLFHQFYLKYWDPSQDLALFFSTDLRGASRNPLIFEPRRMHFLTSTIFSHILSIDTGTITASERAAILKQWLLIGMMLKRMGDMAGWLAVVMAVCAPSIVRLKEMWSMIEDRLKLVVEKEWSPVMRDLFRRDIGTEDNLNSAHVLAPDADGLLVSAAEIVPFYGDLCSAIEEIRQRVVDNSHMSKAAIDLEVLFDGERLLNTALYSYKQFVLELESENEEADNDQQSAISVFQDCFKQLNSLPLDILDVCSPLLLGFSLKCEQARHETIGNESTQNMKAIGAFVPLVFTDLLPNFRLFDASVLLDVNDSVKRTKGQDQGAQSGTSLRRLNSFPPTQLPSNYPAADANMNEMTRIRVAASVSQWKVLKHVKDLAGVSDRVINFVCGNLILKDFEGTDVITDKRRPQSLLVEERKRDSIISRRSSIQTPDTTLFEPDDDLVIKPQRYTQKRSSTREVVIKAATIDMLIDLLIFNISDLRYLQIVQTSSDAQLTNSHLELDRPEYLKMFLVSHRSYCTSAALMRALSDRLAKAFVVSAINKAAFPAWKVASEGLISPSAVDWSLLEKVYTGIYETISTWLSIAPADFTGASDSSSLLENFLSLSQRQLESFDDFAGQSPAAIVCRGLCASNLRKIRRQVLRVRHRPQAWQLIDLNESGLEIHEAFAVARLSHQDDIHRAIQQIDRVVESVLQCITLEDWMQCYEIFEIHRLDPKAFYPNSDEVVFADPETNIQSVLDLLEKMTLNSSNKTVIQCMPLPVRRLVTLRHNLMQWTTQQVANHTISPDARVRNIEILLAVLSTCRTCMSTLDIEVTTGGSTTTQMIPSFIAGAVAAGLLASESRQYMHSWHAVARRAGQVDASGLLTSLMLDIEPSDGHRPIVPCIAWLFERMLEVACYVPDTSYDNSGLFNFDKRRYIYNLLSNLDLANSIPEHVAILEEIDNPFLFLLIASPELLNKKAVRSAAAKEGQVQRGIKVAKPFAQIVQQELEKSRRDHRHKELVDKQIRDAQKISLRQLQDSRVFEPTNKRNTNRGRYGMNSLLRAVRPLSVAITSNWAPDKHQSIARSVAPTELPYQCYIPRGTKPALTIDLVQAEVRICDKEEYVFEIGSEDGMVTKFQAPTPQEMESWVQELTTASITGTSKRRTIIREDAKLASIEESPQFSPRNSMIVDLDSATFGVELATLVRRDGSSTPRIASILISEIERRGLSEIGIYRISGSMSTVTALKRAIDSGTPVDFSEPRWSDINAIAGLFKLWLRELPEPLMTYKLYDQFLATLDIQEYSAKSLALKNLIHQLPIPNFSMLKRLIEHLEAVTDYESTNHMYAHNLAIIFGPNILQPIPSTLSFAASMNDLGKVQTIIRNIIMQCHWIFSTDEETEEILPTTSISLEPPVLPRILEGDNDLMARE